MLDALLSSSSSGTSTSSSSESSDKLAPVKKIRNVFPESWLWTNSTVGYNHQWLNSLIHLSMYGLGLIINLVCHKLSPPYVCLDRWSALWLGLHLT